MYFTIRSVTKEYSTTMNNTDNRSVASPTLQELSLGIIRGFLPIQLFNMSIFTINTSACLLSFLVLWRQSKQFKSRVFMLLRLFFLNDACTSLFTLACNIWHVQNGLRGIDEVLPRPFCFNIVGAQHFLFLNNAMITLLIGLDRLEVCSVGSVLLLLEFSCNFEYNRTLSIY